ncbi:MAG: hypothetical protein GY704_07760, partial [Phycisphaeraceae bacterium]|nr:hypothetical protein [Phycisphaeraceae bacterium]
PAGGEGFLQRFTIEANAIGDPCELEILEGETVLMSTSPGEDFVCRGFTGSGSFTARVVFVGYGVSLPERGYDDYSDIDVSGKIIMAFKPLPEWRPKDNERWGPVHLPRHRARVAAEHGAVGMILVSRPGERTRPPIGSVLHGDGEQDLDFPQIHVSLPVAAELLEGCGLT